MAYTITFSSVSWTTGDIVTEAKLDTMNANDQAYDAHSAQGLQLDNNVGWSQKDASGTRKVWSNLDASNVLTLGISAYKMVRQGLFDYWISPGDTWVYASATTFTIAGVDRTAYFTPGTKLRLKQGGAYLYFVVRSSSFSTNTTVTITGGTSYTLANAVITDNYYTQAPAADGFPAFMAYTPTYTGFSADPNGTAVFSINGRLCTVGFNASSGTSNATNFLVTAPFTAAATGTTAYNPCQVINSGTLSTSPGLIQITGNQSTFALFRDFGGTAWTNSGTKYANFTITFTI